MKTSFALTALFTKCFMLLCISGMSLSAFMSEAQAAKLSPCHQAMAADKEVSSCDMCPTALDSWEEPLVSGTETAVDTPLQTELVTMAILAHKILEPDSAIGLILAYEPPPQVLLKAVTPHTKTIVLVV